MRKRTPFLEEVVYMRRWETLACVVTVCYVYMSWHMRWIGGWVDGWVDGRMGGWTWRGGGGGD